MVKFKNFIFNLFGISFYLGFLSLLIYIEKNIFYMKTQSSVLNIILMILVLLVSIGVRYFLSFLDKEFYGVKNYITILGYIFYHTKRKDRKWIFHSDLGYFLCIITKDRIYLYEPSFLYLKEIYDEWNVGNIEGISKNIKNSLDSRFKNILKIKLENKEAKERMNMIKNWDGYLDTQSRRDKKIDNLLK